MKKPQYITLIVAVVLLGLIWAFGKTTTQHNHQTSGGHESGAVTEIATESLLPSSFSIDSAIGAAKNRLTPNSLTSLKMLETSVEKGADNSQKVHAYHQLSQFWRDSAKAFIPFAWYKAEGARLENSEKNLNFAGHLFLSNLQNVDNPEIMRWMALQAKDLFERSLKLNAGNDSAKVGLGATYLFGNISNAPMTGIAKIKEVTDKDSNNLYAQMTLAMGAVMSGQIDKAKERLEKVEKIDAKNIQAILLLADIFEKQSKKQEAIKYYQKALPLVAEHVEMKSELEKRIDALKR